MLRLLCRLCSVCALCTFCFSLFTPAVSAAGPLTYRHQHFLFTINPADHPEWRAPSESWFWNGKEFDPPAAWRVDGDAVPPLPAGVERKEIAGWNRAAIRATIDAVIGKPFYRPTGSVVIRKTATGTVLFDGVGLPGRAVDLQRATDLTVAALEQNAAEIALPIIETQPAIRVDDPELQAMGIREVVTVGESDFSRSPVNRRFNIAVGLAKFNGHIIPANSVFSFNTVLGKVDGSTGYRRELVIKGDRTEPDYGGGLCQVSSTAYRGVWEYGFPIMKRKNHSYTVSHYSPPGTDATVYPGVVDMVFRNDLPHALLIQTHAKGDLAYFIYYGTRDKRKTDLLGPFIYDRSVPPPDRTELTTDLAPGEKKKLNERVPGLKALWYRFIQPEKGEPIVETVFSSYEARPLFTAIGVESLPEGYGEEPTFEPEFAEDIDITLPAKSSSSEWTNTPPARSTTPPPSTRGNPRQ